MHAQGLIQDIVIILCSAVLISASLRFFRIPPILIYLVTGLIIGPTGTGLIQGQESIELLAELGVVFLLFTLGLEFSLPKLLAVKQLVFGLGSIQISMCFAVFFAVIALYGAPLQAAALCAIVLALSSTAIVSKELTTSHQLKTRVGQLSIGILLFQDLVAVLMLSLIPLWASDHNTTALEQGLTLIKAIAVLLISLFFGRWVLPALFTEVAKTRSQELFILTALAVAMASSYAMLSAGLSMSLGAFIGGMLLGESHFRHQIEADIRPFRDVLLGIFFVSIGMLLDLHILMAYWHRILFFTACLLLFKTALISLATALMREPRRNSLRTGLILAQGGEFGFVLIALGQSHNIIPADVASFTLAIVILSMMSSTLMIRHSDRIIDALNYLWVKTTHQQLTEPEPLQHPLPSDALQPTTLIAGYGRVGQTLGRFFVQENIVFCAIDDDPQRVAQARQAGERVIFGDARQYKLLTSAGIEHAKLLIISFDDAAQSLDILKQVRPEHPDLCILVRTRDNSQMDALLAAGASEVIPEVLEASLMIVSQALMHLGTAEQRVIDRIRETRQAHYQQLHAFYGGQNRSKTSGLTKEFLHPITLEHPTRLSGQSIAQVQQLLHRVCPGAVFIEGYKHHQSTKPSPAEPMQRISSGDTLILRGTPDALEQAQEQLLGA